MKRKASECLEPDDSSRRESEAKRLKVCDDLEELLNSGAYSDVTILVDEQEINAHRSILSARSPFFKALSHYRLLGFSNISYATMKQLLLFVYSGRLDADLNSTMCESLFVAADNFEIPGLKDSCERRLCELLRVDNAIALLLLAKQHGAHRLEYAASKFIVANAWQISLDGEFARLEWPIVAELFRYFAEERSTLLQCQRPSTPSSDSSSLDEDDDSEGSAENDSVSASENGVGNNVENESARDDENYAEKDTESESERDYEDDEGDENDNDYEDDDDDEDDDYKPPEFEN